jgi:hypothetical protein
MVVTGWTCSGSESQDECTRGSQSHIWLRHSVTRRKKIIENDKKHNLKYKNRGYTYYNKPVRTRDTAAWVRGVSWCGKNQHRTRTRGTCFKSTAGLPVPVLNPRD